MIANELRIGNLVMDRGGKSLQIDYMDKHKVYQEMFVNEISVHPLTEYFTRIEPIPLTEEWLVKFGFDKTNSIRLMIDISSYYLQVTASNLDCLILSQDNSISTILRPIKYVHQLQNLYFALTGEELTLQK